MFCLQKTGDVNILKKYMPGIGADDVIEGWEKQSTVYADSDDEDLAKGTHEERKSKFEEINIILKRQEN